MTETDSHALELLRDMIRVRRFEEACVELYSASKIRGFLHLYIGEEAVAVVGALRALQPDDAVVATYREHGHALVRACPPARSWRRCSAWSKVLPRPGRFDAPVRRRDALLRR